MKRLAVIGLMVLALPVVALCQTEADCGGTVSTTLHSGASLAIDSVSLGMEIVPGNTQDTLRVSCTSNRSNARLHMQLSGDAAHARLRVSGDTGHDGNLHLRIEVPRRTNLRVRMAAGQITITGVQGDKDCALTAGQITIADGRNGDYRSVDASVDIGQVQAFGVDKGGFFRQVTTSDAKGEYRLYAHVMTGQIDLVGSKAKSGAGSTD